MRRGDFITQDKMFLYTQTGDSKHIKDLYRIIGPEDFLRLYMETRDKALLKYLIPWWVTQGSISFELGSGILSDVSIIRDLFEETLRVYKYFYNVAFTNLKFDDLECLFDKQSEADDFEDAIWNMLNNLMQDASGPREEEIYEILCRFAAELTSMSHDNRSLNEIHVAQALTINLGGNAMYEKFGLESPLTSYLSKYNLNDVVSNLYSEIMDGYQYECSYSEDILGDFIHGCDTIIASITDRESIYDDIRKHLKYLVGNLCSDNNDIDSVIELLMSIYQFVHQLKTGKHTYSQNVIVLYMMFVDAVVEVFNEDFIECRDYIYGAAKDDLIELESFVSRELATIKEKGALHAHSLWKVANEAFRDRVETMKLWGLSDGNLVQLGEVIDGYNIEIEILKMTKQSE